MMRKKKNKMSERALEYYRQWRKKNPDRVRKYWKRHKAKNPELYRERQAICQRKVRRRHAKKIRARKRKFYRANREKILKKLRRWYKNNRNARREYDRKRYGSAKRLRRRRKWYRLRATDPKVRRTYLKSLRKWRQSRKGRRYKRLTACHHTSIRRARKLKASVGTDQTCVKEFYAFVRTVEKIRCHWCRKMIPRGKGRRTVDHIIPLAKGGTHSRENLAPACLKCNCSKNAKTPDEFRKIRRAKK